MADGRPPAPQPPPGYTSSGTSHSMCATACTSHTANVPPIQPIAPPTQPIQPAPMQQLNSSHFKPEFTSKPDKDVEAHVLRTNDWMDTHVFPEGVKSPAFLFNICRRGKVMI